MKEPIYVVEIGENRKARFAFGSRDEAEKFAEVINEDTDIDYTKKATVFKAERFHCY